MDGNYHHMKGLPTRDEVQYPLDGTYTVVHTNHATRESNENYSYKPFELPDKVTVEGDDITAHFGDRTSTGELVEMTVENGKVVKGTPRVPYGDYDMSFVMNFESRVIITAWLNTAGDYPTPTGRDYREP